MANRLNTNPIVLDTFTSPIDIGKTLYGDSNTIFFIHSIEWESPSTGSTATITNGKGVPIFNETAVTTNQSIIKYLPHTGTAGIKIASGGVTSGKIVIFLR